IICLNDLTVEIHCPKICLGDFYSVLTKRRGRILSEEERPRTSMVYVRAYLPIVESFGFTAELGGKTDQRMSCQYTLDRWELMDGSALDKGSMIEEIVMNIRARKGLKKFIPYASPEDKEVRALLEIIQRLNNGFAR
ncbi:11801_t:CDS:2, partial [Acaulospora colombiana]